VIVWVTGTVIGVARGVVFEEDMIEEDVVVEVELLDSVHG
jgi:hypothetical protein